MILIGCIHPLSRPDNLAEDHWLFYLESHLDRTISHNFNAFSDNKLSTKWRASYSGREDRKTSLPSHDPGHGDDNAGVLLDQRWVYLLAGISSFDCLVNMARYRWIHQFQ